MKSSNNDENRTKTCGKSIRFPKIWHMLQIRIHPNNLRGKGKILRQYVKGENTDLVCFHRPLVAYTEANPSAKAQFCRKSILTNTLMGYIINIPHEGILSQEESVHGLLQSSV